MQILSETSFLRLHQIIGNAKANPPIPPIIPISKSTWWEGVEYGRFPKPVRLGSHITLWKIRDVKKLITDIESE